jgi:hypothetical protein
MAIPSALVTSVEVSVVLDTPEELAFTGDVIGDVGDP